MKKKVAILLIIILILISGCSGKKEDIINDKQSVESSSELTPTPAEPSKSIGKIEPYSDVRKIPSFESETPKEGNYNPEDIKTFWFNTDTAFPGNESLALDVLENGKNPGLGVRSLHERGITGKGIKVAIIDQNLAQPHHPEYGDRIMEYTDVGTEMQADSSSMHGPAVASLLVGKSCGVAPDADLYFVAAPSWSKDSAYYAKALRWIITKNKVLPDGEKIRVVSVSAAPSGKDTYFTQNLEQWDDALAEAEKAGILVLDCREGYDTGIISAGYYDPNSPEDVTLFKTGFLTHPYNDDESIFVPTSFRTTAEQAESGSESYQYTGQGGLSWAIPYAAGVLALGWQVNPTLDNEEIITLLFNSAYIDKNGNKIINPPAFIAEIEAQK